MSCSVPVAGGGGPWPQEPVLPAGNPGEGSAPCLRQRLGMWGSAKSGIDEGNLNVRFSSRLKCKESG